MSENKVLQVMHHIPDTPKHVVDGLSIGTMLGSIMSVLPEIAAVFTIVWTGIRIYETDTVRKIISKDKDEAENKDEDER